MSVAARIAPVLTALALAAGLAACSPAEERAAPDLASADDACAADTADLAAGPVPTNRGELASAAGELAETAETQVERLAAPEQPLPTGPAPAFGALVEPLRATAASAHDLEVAAGTGDVAAVVRAVHVTTAVGKEAAAAAAGAGLGRCQTGLEAGLQTLFAGSQQVVRSRFVDDAAQRCQAAAASLAELSDPDSRPAAVEHLEAGRTILTQLITDLRALPVPPGDEPALAEVLHRSEIVTARIGELREAVAGGDEGAITAIEEGMAEPIAGAEAAWDGYGVPACGDTLGAP